MKKLLSIITILCLAFTMVFSSLISAETTYENYGYLVGLGDSWCQGVGLGSEMESKNAVTLTANTLGWKYKNFGQGGKYASDVLSQMKNTNSDQYKEMLEADTVFVHGGINDLSSNYRPSMVGNSYWDYSVPSSPVQKYNLGRIIKNYDADNRTIDDRTPEKYFDDSLNGAAKNVINILKNVADIIREANPDALIVISTLFCNYTGGIAEFPEGFTFEGLTDAEKLEAADEMADYYFRKYFEQANEGIKAFAENYHNVVVLDDSNIIPQQVRSGDTNDYMVVGHPKAAGYQLLSDGMVNLIREYYGEDSPLFTHVATTKASATTVESSSTTTTKSTITTKQASAGEETKLIFNSDTFTLSDNTANLAFSTSYEGYKMISGTLSEGTGVTMTSKVQVEPGVYDLTVYARARAVRPAFDIEVNGTVVGKSIDTSNTVLGTNNDAPVALKSITIPEKAYVTIKITGSSGITSSWLYLNSLKFTKTADYTGETTLEVETTMESGAAIRLGEVNGIRFYTKVDQEKIAKLIEEGATVEMGTLIAPKDLIGETELTLDLAKKEVKKAIDVKYQAKATDGKNFKYYTEKGGFSGIVGTIANVKEANIAREFVGRGYVKVTKDGKTTITYAKYAENNITNNSRSLAYVAYKMTTEQPEELKQYSETIQDKVSKWAKFYQA